MVVGDTSRLYLEIAAPQPIGVTGAAISIMLPAGVIVGPPPAVTATPGEELSQKQTLSASYLPVIGGKYALVWTCADDQANVLQYTRIAWAYWSPVPALVRDTLEVDYDQLPDEMLDREFASFYRRLQVQYPVLSDYSLLEGDDQHFIDEGVAYLCAVSLFSVRSGEDTGDPTRIKAGGFEFQYGVDKRDERNAWTDRALTAISYSPLISAVIDAEASSWSMYRVSGPSRQAQHSGRARGLLDTILDLYQDPMRQSLLPEAG